jgi:biopolymer transport protein ExbD
MDSQGEINIIPMIDIIFSILAFFIISTLYLTRSEGLPVSLPAAKTAEAKPTPQLNITIKPNGDLFLDRQAIALPALKQGVTKKVQPGQKSLVVINADRAVNHGLVVQVMDTVRQIEGATLAIAATKK